MCDWLATKGAIGIPYFEQLIFVDLASLEEVGRMTPCVMWGNKNLVRAVVIPSLFRHIKRCMGRGGGKWL